MAKAPFGVTVRLYRRGYDKGLGVFWFRVSLSTVPPWCAQFSQALLSAAVFFRVPQKAPSQAPKALNPKLPDILLMDKILHDPSIV